MAYLPTEIGVFRSQVVDDTSANGGLTTRTLIPDMSLNSVFDDITKLQREKGAVHYRKLIFKPNVMRTDTFSEVGALFTALEGLTKDSKVHFTVLKGTETDTQSDVMNQPYSPLHKIFEGDVVGNTLTVEMPPAIYSNYYSNLRVFNPDTGLVRTIQTLSADAAYGIATIQLPEGHNLKVGELFSASSLVTGIENTYDLTPRAILGGKVSANGNVVLNNLVVQPSGLMRDTYTLTFTSADTYTLTGLNSGVAVTGNRNTTLEVYHPRSVLNAPEDVGLKIPSSFFTGGWATGDTGPLRVESGAVALWFKRSIESGAPDLQSSINVGLSICYKTS